MKRNLFSKGFNVFILLDCLLLPVVLLCPLLFSISPNNSLAEENYDDTLCCQCHKEIVEDSMDKIDVHLPFIDHRCSYCHVYSGTDEDEEFPELIVLNVPDHLPMRTKKEISITICLKCHKDFAHPGNHPVNIRPPENATLPDDFSIGPDGRITCVTCHASHASDYEYRTRFCYRASNMKAGHYADIDEARAMGGCFVCHVEKGVLPKNRLLSNQKPSTKE
ncbi:hypothetical protein ACFLZ5_08610 [Thermodesulfobacteriota bacterium]